MMRRSPTLLACLAIAAGLAGCGDQPSPSAPKAPTDSALAMLAKNCGAATMITAEPDASRAGLAELDSAASSGGARKLIAIFQDGPQATYLGESMTRVMDIQIAAMRSCGLDGTAAKLARARNAIH